MGIKDIKKFDDYIMEKYKLIISNEPVQDFSTDIEWLLTLDVKKLWENYDSKKINTVTFITEYKKYLQNKQSEISNKTGKIGWSDLNKIIQEFTDYDEKNVLSKLDEIYDWADKYAVKINA